VHVPEPEIVAVVVLLVGSVAASFVDRLGAPTLLLFLGLGMLLGEDGPGGIRFDNAVLARDVGLLALAVILLEGGMLAELPDIRRAAGPAILLATVGVGITAAVTGVVTRFTAGVGWFAALLVGATVSSTDAAAVFAAIRGLNVRRRLSAMLEAESGLNDPFAALLVIGLVDWKTTSGYNAGDALVLLVRQVSLGAAGGIAIGFATVWMLRRLPLPSAGIAPVVTLSAVLAGYVGVSVLGGSGLLAAYLAGLVIGDARIPHSAVIRGFLQGGAWLAQLGLFVLLGLLVTPHELVHQGLAPLVVALALVLVARPLAVLVCTAPFGVPLRDQGFLAWAGLRGGVPIVFATFPIAAGLSGSERLFDVVFYVVFVSVVLQGVTVRWAARRLDVIDRRPAPRLAELDTATLQTLGADLLEVHPRDLGIDAGSTLAELELPAAAVVVAIERDHELLLPRGSTAVEEADLLYLLVESDRLREVRAALQRVAEAKP
jgi:cell volume regulation protein A